LYESLSVDDASNIIPAIRITLDAGYYLDIPTAAWKANRIRHPQLSDQYRKLLDKIVNDITGQHVVVILSLDSGDDAFQQQQTARKATTSSGDILKFWNIISAKFQHNSLVWYELHNEPKFDSFDIWDNGNDISAGMKSMLDIVDSNNVKGMVLLSASYDLKLDSEILAQVLYQIDSGLATSTMAVQRALIFYSRSEIR
jgi:hypothetical protein